MALLENIDSNSEESVWSQIKNLTSEQVQKVSFGYEATNPDKQKGKEEGKNKEKKEIKEHPLTEPEFQKYFDGKNYYKQSNIGNCWIVAALDSITHLSDYKDKVMKSVTVTKDGFKIRLPMGAPAGYSGAKEYYTNVIPEKQRQTDGKILELLSFNPAEPEKIKREKGEHSKEYKQELQRYNQYQKKLEDDPWHNGVGLQCMIHAFGQSVTGKSTFNYADLTYGPTGSVLPLEEFIYGLSAETTYYYKIKENFVTMPLKNILKTFNPQKQTLTAIVKTNDDYEIMEDFNAHVGLDRSTWPDHVVSVDHVVINKNGEPQIYISDPHSASDPNSLKGPYSFNKFVKMIGGYTFASFDTKRYLADSNLKPLQKYWTNHLALGQSEGHGNATIQSNVEGSRSLWDPVSWRNLCGARGDVLVTDLESNSGKGRKKDIKITGWRQEMKIVDNGNSVRMEIPGRSQILELDNSCFNTKYDENGKPVKNYYYYDAACRVALFVERMLTEYIDPKRGSKKSPFKLHDSGDFEFDIKPNGESWQLLTSVARSGYNQLNNIAGRVSNTIARNTPDIITKPVEAVANGINYLGDQFFNHTIVGDAISDAVDYVSDQVGNAAERTANQVDYIHREYIDPDVTILTGSALMNSLGLKDDKAAKQKIVNFLNDLYDGKGGTSSGGQTAIHNNKISWQK